MSFFRITNPNKRDVLVKEYLATLKRIKSQNLKDRMGELYHDQDAERRFKPVIQSNERMVEAIKKELKPMNPDNQLSRSEYGPLASDFKRKVLARDPGVDTSFGIYFKPNGNPYMGDKPVSFRGDDILVGDQLYYGTHGLWKLITGKTTNQIGYVDEDFTNDDLMNYVRLIRQTNVLYKDFDRKTRKPRSNGSQKWQHYLKDVWETFRDERKEEGSDTISGTGIQFLPGTIKELKEKLNLLLAEFTAGNTTTRNELIAVLDQLRRRKVLTEKEYMTINSSLSS